MDRYENQIRDACQTYLRTNGNLKLSAEQVLAVFRLASVRPNMALFFLVDPTLRGILMGAKLPGLFEEKTLATVEGWWADSPRAFDLLRAFETWARDADEIFCHVSVPFEESRWDRVMRRRGYTPSIRTYKRSSL